MDVCEKSESNVRSSAVANFDPLQTALGKKSVSSAPTVLPMHTEPEVAMLLPEVGHAEQVIQIRVGSDSGTSARL